MIVWRLKHREIRANLALTKFIKYSYLLIYLILNRLIPKRSISYINVNELKTYCINRKIIYNMNI